MYRRKTKWSSSRSRSFGARRGPLARVATRPKIWNRANFYADTSLTVNNASDTCFNSAILLARHNNLARITSEGFGYADQIRYIDIGGVVFDWGFRRETSYDVGTGSSLGITQGVTLATDRLDNTGAPTTAATVQWHRPQPPVAQISTTTPGADAQNQDFPVKIHWRKWERKPHYAVQVTDTGVLEAPEGQYLDARNPTVNKRLKLRIGEQDGLFLIFSAITGPTYAAGGSLGWSIWVQGQIYYRTRF